MVVAIKGVPILDNLADNSWMRSIPLMKDFGSIRISRKNHLRKIARAKNGWILVESVAQGVCDLSKIESAGKINLKLNGDAIPATTNGDASGEASCLSVTTPIDGLK